MRSAFAVHDQSSAPAGEAAWPADMDELCRKADGAALDELAGAVKALIAGLTTLYESLPSRGGPPDRLKPLYRVAHDIRGLGGAVGYPLLTEIAGSLCLLLDRILKDGEQARVTPLRKAAIAMHVRELRQVEGQGRTGSGGEAGARLVAGLRAVTEKASA